MRVDNTNSIISFKLYNILTMRSARFCLTWTFSLITISLFGQSNILVPQNFKHYIDSFNANDNELYVQYYPDTAAWTFLEDNIPFFECPDKALEKTYYFRWWTYRKHIEKTPVGYVITEFLPPVPWAGKYNTISCAAGHHFYEGRWLHDTTYLTGYMNFWLYHSGNGLRKYSSWIADAWLAFLKVHPEVQEQTDHLFGFIRNYEAWTRSNKDETHHLFWQSDNSDGMEVSVGGQLNNNGKPGSGYNGIRPTINSYMYGDARAIAAMAKELKRTDIADTYEQKADDLKQGMQRLLWNDSLSFFGAIALNGNKEYSAILPVRELIGYVPWYFNLPDDNATYAKAWKQLLDTAGFYAPFGPTTCEIRNPYFNISYEGHECQWNGPSWPYATSQILTGMANILNNYKHRPVTKEDYFKLLAIYSNSQRRTLASGKQICWIDENLNPFTGDWISRTRLEDWNGIAWPKEKGGKERGKDYNHSTFCDLVISGLVGIRPQSGNILVINPLIPKKTWDYFCLDNVLYHGKIITVLYDKSGRKYHKGKGFKIFVDHKEVYAAGSIQKAVISI